jgi:predicted DsbA family dithiol-disulfide isomerase
MSATLQFVVYSDYLCPWCANASLRLHQVAEEYAGRASFEWKSYLLRPQPRRPAANEMERERQLEKFRRYAESWRRPAAEEDAYDFRIWEGDSTPPTHSIPAQLVAKAAARVGPDAFSRMHERLLRAYFHENRDISDDAELAELWRELGLPPERLADAADPALRREVLADHEEALALGATGVPAVRLVGNDAVIVGAHPVELYRRWIERSFEREARAVAETK